MKLRRNGCYGCTPSYGKSKLAFRQYLERAMPKDVIIPMRDKYRHGVKELPVRSWKRLVVVPECCPFDLRDWFTEPVSLSSRRVEPPLSYHSMTAERPTADVIQPLHQRLLRPSCSHWPSGIFPTEAAAQMTKLRKRRPAAVARECPVSIPPPANSLKTTTGGDGGLRFVSGRTTGVCPRPIGQGPRPADGAPCIGCDRLPKLR